MRPDAPFLTHAAPLLASNGRSLRDERDVPPRLRASKVDARARVAVPRGHGRPVPRAVGQPLPFGAQADLQERDEPMCSLTQQN